jgi:glutamate formiminotransferase
VLECVVNVSEGRDRDVLAGLTAAAGDLLLDLHSDPDHHRSVLTLAGAEVEAGVRSLATAAVEAIDLSRHHGVHPRLGALDVVPFVPLDAGGSPALVGSALDEAIAARDRFAAWAGEALSLPCFLYGPERPLPEVRRRAFHDLAPDTGPPAPHPSAGACAVGARPVLVAYNVWLDSTDLELARRVAAAVRGQLVRALGLAVAGRCQVSCNLVDPDRLGPAALYDAVAVRARLEGADVGGGELVGLLPRRVLDAVDRSRWRELGLDATSALETRLAAAGR